jgi:regulatory protein
MDRLRLIAAGQRAPEPALSAAATASCDAASVSEVSQSNDVNQAQEAALRRLTDRARSQQDVVAHLSRRGFGAQVIDEVVARLRRVGLIDDAAFARQWVAQMRQAKGFGLARLREDLKRQGIAPELIAAALTDVEEDDDAVAWAFAERRARRLAGLDQISFERRLAGQLARRGFSPAVVRRVVFRLSAERAPGAAG